MPKLKTNKSVAKRFKLSRKGKLRFRRPGKQHLASGKSPGRRRKFRKWKRLTSTTIEKKLATLIHS